MTRRIGLFGGSFDPPHAAHLALARLATEQLALDELRWVVAGDPWQKAGRVMAPKADRAAMVALAIAGEPRWRLERGELEREGPSYTVDTVEALRAHEGSDPAEWVLILGQDQWGRLSTWHRWADLVAQVTFAVAARQGDAPRADPAVAALPHRVEVLALPRIDVSSTDIRDRVARQLPIDAMVPPAVARYIDQHRLYRGNARS